MRSGSKMTPTPVTPRGNTSSKKGKQDADCSHVCQMNEQLNTALTELTQSVNELKSDMKDVKSQLEKLSFDELCSKVDILENKLRESDNKIKQLEKHQDSLRERIIYSEGQSRRDNLLLEGVPEAPMGTREAYNDCVKKVYDVFENTMKLTNVNDIRLSRCHRLGPPRTKQNETGPPPRPRPLIFKFHWFGDRQRVWEAKKLLKDSGFVLREDFPQEIVNRRKKLLPIQKVANDLGHEAFLMADKLHIKYAFGKHSVYSVDTIDNLPPDLHPHNVSTKKTDTCLAFFSSLCPLSNFFDCSLSIDGELFHSVEQYYQLSKARIAGDEQTAARIQQAITPLQCKQSGDRIKLGTKQKTWEQNCIAVMQKGLQHKLMQNKTFKDFLLQTGDRQLAEANGNDTFWGTGIALNKEGATDPNKWKGQNRLGKLLEDLRTTL